MAELGEELEHLGGYGLKYMSVRSERLCRTDREGGSRETAQAARGAPRMSFGAVEVVCRGTGGGKRTWRGTVSVSSTSKSKIVFLIGRSLGGGYTDAAVAILALFEAWIGTFPVSGWICCGIHLRGPPIELSGGWRSCPYSGQRCERVGRFVKWCVGRMGICLEGQRIGRDSLRGSSPLCVGCRLTEPRVSGPWFDGGEGEARW